MAEETESRRRCDGEEKQEEEEDDARMAVMSVKSVLAEFRKLWVLSGPAILTIVFNFMLSAATQMFSGHLGSSDLAGASMANVGIQGIAYGILLGMSSAVQTICGQAYGAKQLSTMGVICQRSMVLTTLAAFLLSFLYAWAEPALLAMGQPEQIAYKGGLFAKGLIPQLYAFGLCNSMQRFLVAQNIVIAPAVISVGTFAVHLVLSWVVIYKFDGGLLGAALTLSASWWILTVATFVYILWSPKCAATWTGFSAKAFHGIWPFFKFTMVSAFMFSLEIWYNQSLVIISGLLPNSEVSLNSLSICMNYWLWDLQLILGISAAASVRVGNEVGAKRPNRARLAVIVSVSTCMAVSGVLAVAVLLLKKQLSQAFTDSTDVIRAVGKMTPLLAISVLLNGIQPLLTAVAIGCGWQGLVAVVNVISYYMIGMPLGMVLAFKLGLNAMGLWWGMICGVGVQSVVVAIVTGRANWHKEVEDAVKRLKHSSTEVAATEEDDDEAKEIEEEIGSCKHQETLS